MLRSRTALVLCALLAPALAAQPARAQSGGPQAIVLPPLNPSSVAVVLQHTTTSVQELADSAAGWKIVEPSVNGRPSGDLSPAEIAAMRSDPARDCQSVLIAYLSIGEAEDYRGYWRSEWVDANGAPIPGVAPSWLGPENPEWPGNYKVRYWHRSWKDLLFGTTTGPDKSAIDRIIDQGFEGVYLDVIDAFEFWSDEQGEITRRLARERMVGLVEQIAQYARITRGAPGFQVFVQNGVEVILDDNGQPDDLRDIYAEQLNGVGLEDLFFDGIRRVPSAETDARLQALGRLFENRLFPAELGFGPRVFVIDYVLKGSNLNTAANRRRATTLHELCSSRGLIPYAARKDRDLDSVVALGGRRWSIIQPNASCGAQCPVCLAGADLTHSPTAAAMGYGAPDGRVDLADYQFFLAAYAAGDDRADLTASSLAGTPGFARPDGRVNFEDLAYFLRLYSEAMGSR